jgi:hypothetical protein
MVAEVTSQELRLATERLVAGHLHTRYLQQISDEKFATCRTCFTLKHGATCRWVLKQLYSAAKRISTSTQHGY